MNPLLQPSIDQHRQETSLFLEDLLQYAAKAGNETYRNLISDLHQRASDPFLFVIVGEVKSGKSSFINALLSTGTEICKVAPQPMTDCIQQIVYGEIESQEQINPFLRIIRQPEEILKTFSIVDTPGTNTIVAHHQEITERFIPSADLVVFVFEAKNPYRQSSWDFFSFIQQDWHKKVLFILQQKDLLTEEELQVNTEGVLRQAKSLGILNPQLFIVSARLELQADVQNSGFTPVRSFIRNHISGGAAPLLKMESVTDDALHLLEKMLAGLAIRKQQWESDRAFRHRIHNALDQQSALSTTQVNMLIENIGHSYLDIARKVEDELSEGLTFTSVLNRTFAGLFSKGASLKNWLDNVLRQLEVTLQSDLKQRLDLQIIDVADRIQQMARVVEFEMGKNPTILPMDHDIYSDIAERRSQVLRELLESFTQFMKRGENFLPADVFEASRNLAPNVVAGSGIAVVGIVLTTVTQGMVFDITGGVLTGLGVLFAGITFGFQRRIILRKYKEEITRGKAQLDRELQSKLHSYVATIRKRIEANFDLFDQLLEQEESTIRELEERAQILSHRGSLMAQKIKQTLSTTTNT